MDDEEADYRKEADGWKGGEGFAFQYKDLEEVSEDYSGQENAATMIAPEKL
jgi:hypothetical protein